MHNFFNSPNSIFQFLNNIHINFRSLKNNFSDIENLNFNAPVKITACALSEALLELLEHTILRKAYCCILCGDFNLDLIKSASHTPTDEFLLNLNVNSYMPLITKPTRVTPNSSTLIDNIFTNNISLNVEGAIIY